MKRSLFLSIAAISAVVSSCSTAAKRNVEQEVAAQSEIESPQQASASGRFAVKQSQHLTEEEKMQFLALMDRTESSVLDIKKKEGHLKAALFQSLSQKQVQPDELNVYKRQLKTLEDEKLNLMFSSLDELRKILKPDSSKKANLEILEYYRSTIDR